MAGKSLCSVKVALKRQLNGCSPLLASTLPLGWGEEYVSACRHSRNMNMLCIRPEL